MKWFVAVFVLLFLSACSMKEYKLFQSEQNEITKINDREYSNEIKLDNIIAPSERVSVVVYNQLSKGTSEISSMMTNSGTTLEGTGTGTGVNGQLVSKSGTIRLPLVGTIKIAGLTEIEAAEMLTVEYKKYLRQPYVSVELVNQRVIVIGEVETPGVVSIANGNMSLIEAIARSGDLSDYAERTNIKIIRGDLRNPEVRIIDLTQLDSIKLSSMVLKGNDIVYVQPRDSKGVNMAFQEISPPFQLLTTMLQPFVNLLFIEQRFR